MISISLLNQDMVKVTELNVIVREGVKFTVLHKGKWAILSPQKVFAPSFFSPKKVAAPSFLFREKVYAPSFPSPKKVLLSPAE